MPSWMVSLGLPTLCSPSLSISEKSEKTDEMGFHLIGADVISMSANLACLLGMLTLRDLVSAKMSFNVSLSGNDFDKWETWLILDAAPLFMLIVSGNTSNTSSLRCCTLVSDWHSTCCCPVGGRTCNIFCCTWKALIHLIYFLLYICSIWGLHLDLLKGQKFEPYLPVLPLSSELHVPSSASITCTRMASSLAAAFWCIKLSL